MKVGLSKEDVLYRSKNLFFRISALIQLGISVLIIVEGDAPLLKSTAIGKRLQSRRGLCHQAKIGTHHATTTNGKNKPSTSTKLKRNNFQHKLSECCELLDSLGVPYIKSAGEAEAMCAALDAAGIVNGCITDDGDCFLYGAHVVYRNFTIDPKDPHVDCYSMTNITSTLGLTRENLVAMALLLGCDYCAVGLPGIGETRAMRLMHSLKGHNILTRMGRWCSMSWQDCVDHVEAYACEKAKLLSDFPSQQVIDEYLVSKESVPLSCPRWRRPDILKFMSVGSRLLDWVEEYCLEKVLPLATFWDQLTIHSRVDRVPFNDSNSVSVDNNGVHHLRPKRLIKCRVRRGIPCVEVEWENNVKGLVDENGDPRRLSTLERADRFRSCYPAFVDLLDSKTLHVKSRGPLKTKPTTASDNVADGFGDLSLGNMVKNSSSLSRTDVRGNSSSSLAESGGVLTAKLNSLSITSAQPGSADEEGDVSLAKQMLPSAFPRDAHASSDHPEHHYVPLRDRLIAARVGWKSQHSASSQASLSSSSLLFGDGQYLDTVVCSMGKTSACVKASTCSALRDDCTTVPLAANCGCDVEGRRFVGGGTVVERHDLRESSGPVICCKGNYEDGNEQQAISETDCMLSVSGQSSDSDVVSPQHHVLGPASYDSRSSQTAKSALPGVCAVDKLFDECNESFYQTISSLPVQRTQPHADRYQHGVGNMKCLVRRGKQLAKSGRAASIIADLLGDWSDSDERLPPLTNIDTLISADDVNNISDSGVNNARPEYNCLTGGRRSADNGTCDPVPRIVTCTTFHRSLGDRATKSIIQTACPRSNVDAAVKCDVDVAMKCDVDSCKDVDIEVINCNSMHAKDTDGVDVMSECQFTLQHSLFIDDYDVHDLSGIQTTTAMDQFKSFHIGY